LDCLKFCSNVATIPKSTAYICKSYADDCLAYLSRNDLWTTLKSIASSVDIGYGIGISGIPYYPINEEGAVGVQQRVSVPFGAYGGGYSGYTGVRDYWSQFTEAGANWIDGTYGYRSGWSVPLVQSLGIEGYRGTRVAVPLDQRNFGKIGVDTGLGVGGYYAQNDHTGVDWKEGNVNHQFGVGVPFAGVGVNTGTSVFFPSLNTWLRALGP
uniref:Apple domain-containing protein n=1 Tax=Syphacia muris TaxID=451379 RepID=A0A0N5A9X9_9BILA